MIPPDPDSLTGFLSGQDRLYSRSPAILDRGITWTYGDLDEQSRRLATALAAAGVRKGDRVALWLPNTPAYLALFFACGHLGAIAVSVNTRYRSHEVADILKRSGCCMLVFWPEFKGISFTDILADVPADALDEIHTIVCFDETSGSAGALPLPGKTVVRYGDLCQSPPMQETAGKAADPCLIFTTSGTSAAPKFVLHSQQGLTRHARAVAQGFGYDQPEALLLQNLPFCGTFGMAQALATLAAGRPFVNMLFYDATETVRLMQEHSITHTNGSDVMFSMLLKEAQGDRPFPRFQYAGFGGFNPELGEIVRDAEERGLRLTGIYGMSEVQALFARQPPGAPLAQRRLAGGRLIPPGARVRIRHPETGQLLPPGEKGEIELHSPGQMIAYFGDERASRETLTADGFVRTGDLGYLDGEGGFVFLSRMGDVLRLGGFLVSPAEIEACLQQHPGVERAQVVGVHARGGPAAFAWVVGRNGSPVEESVLLEHCARGLAKFKVPVGIRHLDRFPVTAGPNGEKIQRHKLRDMARQVMAGG